jgi:hypothetical protein
MGQRGTKGVLLLCTGNYYRSRFAEILFNSVAGKMRLSWKASSAALALERGVNNVGPMAAAAVRALEALGVSAAEDCARLPAQVTAEDLGSANWIVARTADLAYYRPGTRLVPPPTRGWTATFTPAGAPRCGAALRAPAPGRAYDLMTRGVLPLVADKDKYRPVMSAGFGL